MYERLSTSLDEWKEDSPQEVTRDDWQDFLEIKTMSVVTMTTSETKFKIEVGLTSGKTP